MSVFGRRITIFHGHDSCTSRKTCGLTRDIAASPSIDVPAVSDACDAHHLAVVIDDIDDTVVPHPDTPEILVATQFLSAGGPRIGGQAINLRHYPRDEVVAQTL